MNWCRLDFGSHEVRSNMSIFRSLWSCASCLRPFYPTRAHNDCVIHFVYFTFENCFSMKIRSVASGHIKAITRFELNRKANDRANAGTHAFATRRIASFSERTRITLNDFSFSKIACAAHSENFILAFSCGYATRTTRWSGSSDSITTKSEKHQPNRNWKSTELKLFGF